MGAFYIHSSKNTCRLVLSQNYDTFRHNIKLLPSSQCLTVVLLSDQVDLNSICKTRDMQGNNKNNKNHINLYQDFLRRLS